ALPPPALPSFPTRRSSDLMPKIRLLPLLLAGGVAALIAASSVLAVGGSAPIVHHSAAGIEQTSGGSDEALSAQEQETGAAPGDRSEEHTSELQSPDHLVCR